MGVKPGPQQSSTQTAKKEGCLFRIIFRAGAIQVFAILASMSNVTAVLLGEGAGALSVIDQVVQPTISVCAPSPPFAAVKILSRAYSDGEFESTLPPRLALVPDGPVRYRRHRGSLSSLDTGLWFGSALLKLRPYRLIASPNIPAMVLGRNLPQQAESRVRACGESKGSRSTDCCTEPGRGAPSSERHR
jgi:hypothetical protein